MSKEVFEIGKIWGEFSDKLSKDQEYTVYINLKMNSKGSCKNDNDILNLIKTLGLSILEYEDIVHNHQDVDKTKLPINKEKKYMIFKSMAKDVKSAALKAVSILNSKITILPYENLKHESA